MSKLDLRDISDRLTRSRDADAVVFELLGYLQSVRQDWRVSLCLYDAGRDTLTTRYVRQKNQLQRQELNFAVDGLPARLVRKFFHPSAFFNHTNRRSMLTTLFQSSPAYEAPVNEAPALRPVVPITHWLSCTCLPLTERDDVLGLLVLASPKKDAFTAALGDIVPVKSMASLALGQHLSAPTPARESQGDDRRLEAAAAEFQDQIRGLREHARRLEAEIQVKDKRLEELAKQLGEFNITSTSSQKELVRTRASLRLIETQSASATEQLSEAFSQLNDTQSDLDDVRQTVHFMREIFQVLSQVHRREEFAATMLTWFCEHFGVERCSLMLHDGSEDSLRIAAFRGIAPDVANDVRVRMGHGIAGWVAHHRKPLIIRAREDETAIEHTDQDAYNSDSFICVPLVYGGELFGVLNLSNKRDGEAFDDIDLDRAMLTGSILAMLIGTQVTPSDSGAAARVSRVIAARGTA